MNFRKLLTYLTVSTAAVIPFAGAQNPTILQGSYISNVFGNSNFVLNPNAQTNIANVTNATRSTTTPLVATSEFTLALASGANATWTLRAFDSGMKGQNCEARFSYRGFATATTKAEIVQNSLVVAHLVLTPSTDPRIASINFPCGDLANATTFRIAQTTAAMTGTNEIGGIYVGLATNMANVAQAEFVGGGEWASTSYWTRSANVAQSTFVPFTGGSGNYASGVPLGKATAVASDTKVTFASLPAGEYMVIMNLSIYNGQTAAGECKFSIQEITSNTFNGQSFTGNLYTTTTIYPGGSQLLSRFNFTSATTREFRLVSMNAAMAGASQCNATVDVTSNKAGIYVYRFPSASELVVTPERQNTFGGAQWTGSANFGRSNTTEIPVSNANFATNRSLFGKAQFTGTANDVAITIPSMPPGSYKVQLAGKRLSAQKTAVGTADFGCTFTIKDGTNSTSIVVAQYGIQYSINSMPIATGVFTYSSLADRTFTAYLNGNNTNSVDCEVDGPKIIITPLDQPSNSALYVQGPVKAAETGAAIPAGYVGYVQEAIRTSDVTLSATAGTYNDVTGLSITLDPGVWEIEAQGQLYVSGAAGVSPNGRLGSWQITDNAGTPNVQREVLCGFTNGVVGTSMTTCRINLRLLVTTTTVYKVRAASIENSVATTNPTAVQVNASSNRVAYIRAVRIN